MDEMKGKYTVTAAQTLREALHAAFEKMEAAMPDDCQGLVLTMGFTGSNGEMGSVISAACGFIGDPKEVATKLGTGMANAMAGQNVMEAKIAEMSTRN